ncbi:MauE/DoxX family redox-associated membrane protein [Pseudoduganella chitinolytica]|uniref:Methylamine utilization protein MauE n=1 Tax=Pseudoduganella chitinolytica TaxID=34070 RepID=A0ABY8B8E6_9BURK|nr:MauE/DoxX family redox-associated membrane protein [Pseudoduganella chitinolytica]WEF32205.1 hypothetical protein PX653_22735 [Pseudoduganella chitinolytica]
MNSLSYLSGIANGMLALVFCLSAVGRWPARKTVEYRAYVRPGVEFVFGYLLIFGVNLWLSKFIALYSLIISVAGLIYGIFYAKKKPCKCFGGLSNHVEGYIVPLRCVMVVSAVAVLVHGESANDDLRVIGELYAAFFGNCIILFGLKHVNSPKSLQGASTRRYPEIGDLVFRPGLARKKLSVADLVKSDGELLILVVSKGCEPCNAMKREALALRGAGLLPMPIWFLPDGAGDGCDPENTLIDEECSLSNVLGIRVFPSLLHVGEKAELSSPIAAGIDAGRQLLYELILKQSAPRPPVAVHPNGSDVSPCRAASV